MSSYTVEAPVPSTPEAEEIWLAKRPRFIGASESAAILGLSPYSTPRDVWESKQPGAEPIPENRFMQWGKRLEPVVAEWLEHDYPQIGVLSMPEGLLASRDLPWLSATLDRENSWDEDGFVTGLTEIKTGSAFTRGAWWEDGEPVVPPYYEVQAQQQMLVRGVRKAYVGALLGGNELILRDVEFNPAFAELLVDELDAWRQQYLIPGTPPPSTARDVWRFDGKPKGDAAKVVATDRVVDLWRQRLEVQPKASALKKQDDEIKGEIQAFMEDAGELVDDAGKLLVTWYRGADKEVTDWKALAAAHPEIVAEFTSTAPGSRTMYFKK